MCAWLAYGSQEKAAAHTTEAAVLGSLLALSFLASLASLAGGLRFGGPWRELPASLSWPVAQFFEVRQRTRGEGMRGRG